MPNLSGCVRGHVRPVDNFIVHGEPISFRKLCDQAIPDHTDYVVLDLDHTVHLRRNMGEIFGWELSVHHSYDSEYLARVEGSREPGRGHVDLKRPLGLMRYGWSALENWALPGLFYLFWAKLICSSSWTNWLAYRVFGTEPRRAIQSVPQHTLFRVMAGMPLDELRKMARAMWDRHRVDQVVTREDIAWLKKRCPKLKVILSSASPQPVLEVAAADLGVDGIFYSRVGEYAGCLSTPLWGRALRRSRSMPNRISAPDEQVINARGVKVDRLSEAFPDIFSSVTHTVGLTDTAYGEDHCWSDYFDTVIDINSSDPFPPIVRVDSPLQEIHSALVLTRSEYERCSAGEANFMDSRRRLGARSDGFFQADDLRKLLSAQIRRIESLADRYDCVEQQLREKRDALFGKIQLLQEKLQESVLAYNSSESGQRRDALGCVRQELEALEHCSAELVAMERPLVALVWKTETALQASRGALAFGVS